jgi:hypothetical protein
VHSPSAISLTPYNVVQLWVRPTAANQDFVVGFVDANDNYVGTQLSLNSYATLTANTWTMVRVPLADLGVTGKSVNGLQIQDNNGAMQPIIYFDDISLTK